jgi:hypothetical protein
MIELSPKPCQVDIYHHPPRFFRHVVEPTVTLDACVRNHDVESHKFRDRLVDGLRHLLETANVNYARHNPLSSELNKPLSLKKIAVIRHR